MWWFFPAIPVLLVGFAAVVGVLTYEDPTPTEDVILEGFGTFLLVILTVWLASALLLGWGVRLWRSGRRAPAALLLAVGAGPWVWFAVA